MEDIHIRTDAMGTAVQTGPKPAGSPPTHDGPADRAKDLAKKLLGAITGRPRS